MLGYQKGRKSTKACAVISFLIAFVLKLFLLAEPALYIMSKFPGPGFQAALIGCFVRRCQEILENGVCIWPF